MTEDKNTLKILDETITAVNGISEKFNEISNVLKSAKEELIKLENEKDKIETEKKGLEIATRKLADSKNELEKDKKQLEKDKEERDVKIGALTEEQVKLLDEYEKLKVELKKFASAAVEAEEAEFNFERIKSLLSIYAVLIEKIFQGQPHYRILLTLHGEKETMTREELKNTTGIGGAFVLRSVQELAKVGLLEYDMDTGTAKLISRLFPKEALKE